MANASELDKPGYCTLCRSRCGTLNRVENGRLISVQPDPSHPTGKAMCLKGKAAPELVYSADRILQPMRRTQPKSHPDPGWQVISWEEALDEVAQRLGAAKAQSGAESVGFAVTTPSGTPLSDSIDWIERFIRLFGSPNTCYATEICNWHKDHAHAFTFGCGMAAADYRNADVILLWGHNPTNTWLAQAEAIGAGIAGGARLIVADPRQTALAGQAASWLQVKPGQDLALAMGLANLLIENASFDEAFVRQHSNAPLLVRSDNGRFLRSKDLGLPGDEPLLWVGGKPVPSASATAEDLAAAELYTAQAVTTVDGIRLRCEPAFSLYAKACSEYCPGKVERLAGVSEPALRKAAALLGAAKRVAFHAWSGVGQQANATQIDRALACLYALTGSFDKRGGNRQYGKVPTHPISTFDLLAPEQLAKALGIADRPLGPPSQGWVTARDLYTAIVEHKPYAVRTLMAFGTNLLVSQPETHLGRAALQQLDFYVHCDLFESPSARYADIFLPVNTPWEREGLRVGFEISERAEQWVQLRQQMVPSQGESRSDYDLVIDLAQRLGMSDQFFGGSVEAGWNHLLAPSGLTVGQLRARPEGIAVPTQNQEQGFSSKPRTQGFKTPTGLVELYSERLLAHGYPPVPQAPAGSDEVAMDPRYPLILSSAKNGYFCHSQHRSLGSLRKKALQPVLEISAHLAQARGIDDGDPVLLSTPTAQARFIARIAPHLHPAVVVGEYGWWQRCEPMGQAELPIASGGSNLNALFDGVRQDPVSGSSPLRAHSCQVVRDPGVDQALRRWAGVRTFTVTALQREVEDVMTVHIEAAEPGYVPDFFPGQHISLQVPTAQGVLRRAYSLIGPAKVPARRGYSVAIRHAKGIDESGGAVEGLMSGHVHRVLKVGDRIEASMPGGNFILPTHGTRPLVLIASGIGITPFLNLLESLAREEPHPPMLLLYGNRDGASHAFRGRLAALQRQLPELRIVNLYSQPRPTDVQGQAYDQKGRIDASLIPAALLKRRPLIYLCGAMAMMKAITADLIAAGVPRLDIQFEAFRSPPVAAIAPGQAYEVTFARSGISQTWTSSDGPLLGFAERLGVSLPSGCRVGQCESCAVRIRNGSVVHLHGQAPDTHDTCLACQAVPTSVLTLDA
ncbi:MULTISPECIES: molybdopterin-dependent oxidoreductase [unclassified Pseudomonas]|uniref:molybdopterin-dependent oxidoreductase n=1 Tax=unclassified Pseudomonas TaxID=196821 RepID=UPI000BC48C3E|nr:MULTISPECIES: molybdopterin-dependent oxidoreductase [unclassified Pseudomonas]PVZ19720.1 anaerobic selenocysteine-containing dehydrogenase [Pseudomonas sp. URIL14HWK12:I12]PVZ22695.1 anaerobic selenocysteine-containing dehydrogenase [Pseudomonas sp. URIL14HWK12:I10]PVZ37675.1 anaerobic selenocysteine-containing dehydrogenase [Pseudomonas sp. URIL14HWK12:I11]SNZ15482.1 Anaerobic selenocysteine-containing dehydrogenase [Pseudomonas sp. URIL14HWK12:I9]